ncbi:hypothetical protein [Streptomyces qinglanensis]|uniref:Uncharacterized protein n=1 Tax=Streptomyces qinglanensis TaxID=943816 RepID=A0A1H9S8D7_9ACTN|nr:hypothetical protein [Streptomyces qinglanensis]SER81306.1 hypothetical protein SAMN05421870_104354 [Streptomyces qinglanensis]
MWWAHGDMDRAAAAYRTARAEAEEERADGEAAACQAQFALALSFTDPQTAAEEIDLAERLLASLDMRAPISPSTSPPWPVTPDARTPASKSGHRSCAPRRRLPASGNEAEVKLETALAFHRAVRDGQEQLAHSLGRLRDLSPGRRPRPLHRDRPFPGRPPARNATARWIDGGQATRGRGDTLVQHRRATV